jgi:hypothetical protein
LQHEGKDQQDHQIRRENPKRSVTQVPADRPRLPRPRDRGGERPVEEEARKREEENHAEPQIEKHLATDPVLIKRLGAPEQPCVENQDRERRKRSESLDAR